MSLVVDKNFVDILRGIVKGEQTAEPIAESAEVEAKSDVVAEADVENTEELAQKVTDFIDEQLVPQIEKLLDEGFSEDEVHKIILNMLETEEETEK